jgi:tetratricopeptide (TPR) repeat protein
MTLLLLPLLILLSAPPQGAPAKPTPSAPPVVSKPAPRVQEEPESATTQPGSKPEPTKEETPSTQAKRLGKEGANAYQRGDTEEAIRLWKEAYKLKSSVEFLFNLGAAYWRLARYAEAAEAYDQFLERAPETHPIYKEAERNLLECQREYLRLGRLSSQASAGVLPSAPALELPRQVEERIAEIRQENRRRALWVTGASSAALAGVVASFFLLRPEPPEPDPAFGGSSF